MRSWVIALVCLAATTAACAPDGVFEREIGRASAPGACPARFTRQGDRCVPPEPGQPFQGLVGIYYVLLHCPFAEDNTHGDVVRDVTKIRAGLDRFGPWSAAHWANQPEGGYYCLSRRPDVLRRHAELLRDAGVDFVYVDATNHPSSVDTHAVMATEMIVEPFRALLESWSTIDGAPRIVPWAPLIDTQDPMLPWMMTELSRYPELALLVDGRPFMLAVDHGSMPIRRDMIATIEAAVGPVSYRPMWDQGQGGADHWGHSVWCDGWGSGAFRNAEASIPCNQPFRGAGNEQLSVSPAFNHYRFSVPGQHVPRFHGRTFVRMLERVWDYPEVPFIMINGWNEWGAGRWENCGPAGAPGAADCGADHIGRLNFVDNYSEERSRDFEPAAEDLPSGLPRDFYYRLLRECVAKLRRGELCRPEDGLAAGSVLPTGTEQCTVHDCSPRSAGTAGVAEMGDFTGDGFSEYADTTPSTGTFWVHRNEQNGSFDGAVGHDAAVGQLAVGFDLVPVTGDFDCDRLADVADYSRAYHRLGVRRNQGDGTFAPADTRGWGEFFNPAGFGKVYAPFPGMDVLAGDFDGDGCDDILTRNFASGRLEIHLNRYRSTGDLRDLFADPVTMTLVAQVGTDWRILVGDFDGDGLADMADQLVGGQTPGRFWIHRNLGVDGGFQFDTRAWGDYHVDATFPAADWQNWKMVLGDWDGDGRTDYADLYVGPDPNWRGMFWMHRNLGDRQFTPGGDAWGTPTLTHRPDEGWALLGE